MHMGSPVRFLMAGVFAVVAGSCVYVPPEVYYGSRPRRNYYVEEVREPIRPRPPYRQQYWNRDDLDLETERGYREERYGRARKDRYEDRYARRNRVERDEEYYDEEDVRDDNEPRRGVQPSVPPERSTVTPPSPPPKLAQPPAQEKKEILTGTRTKNPDRVKSPYSPFNELDVAGMASGSLARDPTTGRVFRVP